MLEGCELFVQNIITDEILSCTILEDKDQKIKAVKKNSQVNDIDFISNRKFNLLVYNKKKGEWTGQGYITKIKGEILTIELIESMKYNQKRTETRVNVEIPILVNKFIKGDNVLNLPKYIPFTITNISASGLLLECDFNVPPHVNLWFELPIDNSIISITAKIVRTDQKDKKNYYGCQFYSMEESDRRIIRQYVFRKQVELKKKQDAMKD